MAAIKASAIRIQIWWALTETLFISNKTRYLCNLFIEPKRLNKRGMHYKINVKAGTLVRVLFPGFYSFFRYFNTPPPPPSTLPMLVWFPLCPIMFPCVQLPTIAISRKFQPNNKQYNRGKNRSFSKCNNLSVKGDLLSSSHLLLDLIFQYFRDKHRIFNSPNCKRSWPNTNKNVVLFFSPNVVLPVRSKWWQ